MKQPSEFVTLFADFLGKAWERGVLSAEQTVPALQAVARELVADVSALVAEHRVEGVAPAAVDRFIERFPTAALSAGAIAANQVEPVRALLAECARPLFDPAK